MNKVCYILEANEGSTGFDVKGVSKDYLTVGKDICLCCYSLLNMNKKKVKLLRDIIVNDMISDFPMEASNKKVNEIWIDKELLNNELVFKDCIITIKDKHVIKHELDTEDLDLTQYLNDNQPKNIILTGDKELDILFENGSLTINDLIDCNFDLSLLSKKIKKTNTNNKKSFGTNDKEVDDQLKEVFGLEELSDFTKMSISDIMNAIIKISLSGDISKIINLAKTVKEKLNDGTLNKDKIWNEEMKKRTDELLRIFDVDNSSYVNNKVNLQQESKGCTEPNIILQEVTTLTHYYSIEEMLKVKRLKGTIILKIDNIYNRDVKKLLTLCYDRYKSIYFSDDKVTFYFTSELIDQLKKEHAFVNRIKFKNITK